MPANRTNRSNRTKDRTAKRNAAFKRDDPASVPKKGGRPPSGNRPLREHPLAREALINHLMLCWLKWSKHRAARFAAAVGSRRSLWIEFEFDKTILKKEWEGVGFKFTGGGADRGGSVNNPLNRRAKTIRNEGPSLIAGATGDNLIWVQLTLQALQGYFTALFTRDVAVLDAAAELLKTPAIGWPLGARAELLLKAERYQRAKIELIRP
jgi:hypothetical protein